MIVNVVIVIVDVIVNVVLYYLLYTTKQVISHPITSVLVMIQHKVSLSTCSTYSSIFLIPTLFYDDEHRYQQ